MRRLSVVAHVGDRHRQYICSRCCIPFIPGESNDFPEPSEGKIQLNTQSKYDDKMSDGSNGDWFDISGDESKT